MPLVFGTLFTDEHGSGNFTLCVRGGSLKSGNPSRSPFGYWANPMPQLNSAAVVYRSYGSPTESLTGYHCPTPGRDEPTLLPSHSNTTRPSQVDRQRPAIPDQGRTCVAVCPMARAETIGAMVAFPPANENQPIALAGGPLVNISQKGKYGQRVSCSYLPNLVSRCIFS